MDLSINNILKLKVITNFIQRKNLVEQCSLAAVFEILYCHIFLYNFLDILLLDVA